MSISSNEGIVKIRNLVRGFAGFARSGFNPLTIKQAVHDGDTVKVELLGNFSVRFLGVDTPEMTLQYPKVGSPDDEKWLSVAKFGTYLTDPFSPNYGDSQAFVNNLMPGLVNHLKQYLGPGCATDHRDAAEKAQKALEDFIIGEYIDRAQAGKHYSFFMAFSHEIMDGYGRLLCYLYRNNTKAEQQSDPLSYNEKMLRDGWAYPYFIWPNVTPFFYPGRSISDSIPDASQLQNWINSPAADDLNKARKDAAIARNSRKGVWSYSNLLAPFELRYLSRRTAPNRYVLDLGTCSPQLLKPDEYYKVPNHEDRLFIDEHYLPLFHEKHYL